MINIILFLLFLIITYFTYIFITYKKPKKPKKPKQNKLLNKNFYTLDESYPYLNKIYDNLDIYKSEINKLTNEKWIDWVEKDLYKTNTKDGDWKIIPFYGFNIWVDDNCTKCPKLTKFLKSIPNLKTATLSKMGPDTILSEHRGWANLSNFVLRCHFGLDIPDNCFISVGNYEKDKPEIPENIVREVKKYKQDKWLIFDDSKFHYTWNKSKKNKNRIVLLIDIERPPNIQKGTAVLGDTKELIQLIDYFKNIKDNKDNKDNKVNKDNKDNKVNKV